MNNRNIYIQTYSPRKSFIVGQKHYVTDSQMLIDNPINNKKVKEKQSKLKSKSKSKESYLSQALKKSHSNKGVAYQQISTQNIFHCKSLQKLQIITNDRNNQIKTLIHEKALLIAQNQQLKAKLINPTFRQQDFIQKIVKKDLQIENLKESLKRKEEKILELENEHRLEIERLKTNFSKQLSSARQELGENNEDSRRQAKVYYTQATTNEGHPFRQVVQAASYSYEPTTVNSPGTGIYKIPHSSQDLRSLQHLIKTNSIDSYINEYKKQKQIIDQKQQFQTYIGQDGYQRRVYYRNIGNDKIDSYQYGQTQRSEFPSYGVFTNGKIASLYESNSPEITPSACKYSPERIPEETSQNYHKLHNQNLYSKTLTFQCFNQKSCEVLKK